MKMVHEKYKREIKKWWIQLNVNLNQNKEIVFKNALWNFFQLFFKFFVQATVINFLVTNGWCHMFQLTIKNEIYLDNNVGKSIVGLGYIYPTIIRPAIFILSSKSSWGIWRYWLKTTWFSRILAVSHSSDMK